MNNVIVVGSDKEIYSNGDLLSFIKRSMTVEGQTFPEYLIIEIGKGITFDPHYNPNVPNANKKVDLSYIIYQQLSQQTDFCLDFLKTPVVQMLAHLIEQDVLIFVKDSEGLIHRVFFDRTGLTLVSQSPINVVCHSHRDIALWLADRKVPSQWVAAVSDFLQRIYVRSSEILRDQMDEFIEELQHCGLNTFVNYPKVEQKVMYRVLVAWLKNPKYS